MQQYLLQQGKIDDFTGSELEDCDNYSLSQVIVVLVIKQTMIRAGMLEFLRRLSRSIKTDKQPQGVKYRES